MGKITIAVVEWGGYMMSDFQSQIILFLCINKHLAYEREFLVCMIWSLWCRDSGHCFWLWVSYFSYFDVFIEMMVLMVGLHLAEQMPSSPNSLLEWSLSSSLLKRLPCTALLSASFFLHEQANQERNRRKSSGAVATLDFLLRFESLFPS